MAFLELKSPRTGRGKKSHKVIVRFYHSKETIYISIPIEIAKSIGINVEDRVSFAYDDSNPRIWLIKKWDKGFKVNFLNRSRSQTTIRLALSNSFGIIPTEDDFKTREVEHDFYEGGLRIFS